MARTKTVLLMIGLVLIFMYCGNLIAGEEGMKTAFWAACGMNFFSYFFSDKMVLSHYKATEVNASSQPVLHQIVARLANVAGVPMPKIYIIPDDVPNAFATGRNPQHAAVAVTRGLLNLMTPQEIEGVLAHEMSHVKHYDILIGSIAAVFAGAIAMIGNFGRYGARTRNSNRNTALGAVLMPLAATVIQMAISRTREYKADEGAAYLTRHPEWLISALQKLEGYSKNYQMQKANSQTAHMFIINPFGSMKSNFTGLFSTHPSTKDRIERLAQISQKFN